MLCTTSYKWGGGGGGGPNMVKRKELQFGLRGRVWEGDMSPPAQSAEAKIFFKV